MRQNINENSSLPSRKTKMVIEEPPEKKHRLTYILLGIAAIFVLYFGYNMFAENEETLTPNDTTSEQGTIENTDQQGTTESTSNQDNNDQTDTTTNNPDQAVSNDGEGAGTDSESTDATTDSSAGSEGNVGNEDSVNQGFEGVIGENMWEPIGTTQQEPHVMSFELDSTDWNEMVKAVLYATKIPEDKLIIWRLQNGGAPDLAIGTVSTYEYRNSPFQVHLKWVTNEGWMPTKVFQLEHNAYFNE